MTLEEYAANKAKLIYDEFKDDIFEECRGNGGHITVESKFHIRLDDEFKNIDNEEKMKIVKVFFENMKKMLEEEKNLITFQGPVDINKEDVIYSTLMIKNKIAVAGVFDHRSVHIDIIFDDEYTGKDKLRILAESNAYKTFKENKDQIKDGMRQFKFKIDIEPHYHLKSKRRDYIRAFDNVMKKMLNDTGVILEGGCTLSYSKDDMYNLTMSYNIKRVERGIKK